MSMKTLLTLIRQLLLCPTPCLQDQLLAQLVLMREDIARLRTLASYAVRDGTGDGTQSASSS